MHILYIYWTRSNLLDKKANEIFSTKLETSYTLLRGVFSRVLNKRTLMLNSAMVICYFSNKLLRIKINLTISHNFYGTKDSLTPFMMIISTYLATTEIR